MNIVDQAVAELAIDFLLDTDYETEKDLKRAIKLSALQSSDKIIFFNGMKRLFTKVENVTEDTFEDSEAALEKIQHCKDLIDEIIEEMSDV